MTNEDYDAIAVMTGAELASENDGDFTSMSSALDYRLPMKNSLGKIASDTSFTKNGFTINFYRKFFNATGDSTNAYVRGETIGMFTKRSITGSRTNTNLYMERTQSHRMHITGLDTLSTAVTLNGTDQKYMLHEMNSVMGKSGTHTFTMNGSGTIENLVINKNDGNRYPESGVKTMNMTVDKIMSKNNKTKSKTSTMEITITFNGTANPDLTVNKTKTYTVNLSSGHVVKK